MYGLCRARHGDPPEPHGTPTGRNVAPPASDPGWHEEERSEATQRGHADVELDDIGGTATPTRRTRTSNQPDQRINQHASTMNMNDWV